MTTKALIVQLADDVVDHLNKKQGGWAVGFKAERVYYPKTDYEDLSTLHVHVSVVGWEKTPDTRSSFLHETIVEIGLQYRADPKAGDEAKAKFDDLCKLVEEITDYWEDTRPTVSDCQKPTVGFGPGQNGMPYVPELIQQNNFTSVIRLTFKKSR